MNKSGGHSLVHCSPNYDYVVSRVLRDNPEARVLDFGCGTGTLIAHALEKFPQSNFQGVDTFDGMYENWKDRIPERLAGRIHKIEGNVIPFPDNHFDAVVSNQVFEHILEPLPSLREINRVLRPGGRFLALFPTRDIWFEGHLGLWLPHRLDGRPDLQRRYIGLMRRLGRGYYKGKFTIEEWSDRMTETLRNSCFYHDWSDVWRWWIEAFGAPPRSAAVDYMRFRLGASSRLKALQALADKPFLKPFLEFVCHKRAGRVLEIEKRG